MTHPGPVDVPDWAKDAVWYQVFPERFRNGCPDSNPRLEDTGMGQVPGWEISPWGSEWYGQQDWEKKQGRFFRSVYSRRYGGDLVGVIQKLDYLAELGINAIYLNPVFTAQSLHKYDGSCFHHVDPTFGPDRAGDLKALERAAETEDPSTWIWTRADLCLLELLEKAHQRGIRVILDGVFNHTGRAFFAFQDLLKNGKDSRYRDWYIINRWYKDGTFSYKGWFNFKGLPEFGRDEENLVPPVREYIYHATERWMKPVVAGQEREGIDGWRLDVAFCVPPAFWRGWRKHVKALNAEAYITGEIVSYGDDYVQGDMFDAVMNYMWLYAAVNFFTPDKHELSSVEKLQADLDEIRRRYPDEVQFVVQNLLDSHDVARIATMLANPQAATRSWDDYFESTRVKNFPELKTSRPDNRVWSALKQVVMFQMTYLGAPMLYYGTEVGMWGANDPCNRQPMLWDDVSYEPETKAYRGGTGPTIRQPDQALFAFFQKAIRMRKEHPVLNRGSLTWMESGHSRVLAFARAHDGNRVLVYLNASDEPVDCEVPVGGACLWSREPVQQGLYTVEPRGWLVVEASS